MNGVSRKVHTPRIDAPRGTQKRVENRTIDAHIYTYMHAPVMRLCIYGVSQKCCFIRMLYLTSI